MNNNLEQFKSHPIMQSAQDLKILCKPLEQLSITTFSHLRVDKENRLSGLCNQPEFIQNYLRKEYYNADPCVKVKPETLDVGQCIIWDVVDCRGKTAKMMQDAADFGFKHVFTIMKNQSGFSDFYHFGTAHFNPSINQLYINQVDLLNQFIAYFTAQTKRSKVLSSAYDLQINSVQPSTASSDLFSSTNIKAPRHQFLQSLANTPIHLTQKEQECVKGLMTGKTAKEMAQQLGLSYRTIEDRIDRLKLKLNATNKADLIIKLMESEQLLSRGDQQKPRK